MCRDITILPSEEEMMALASRMEIDNAVFDDIVLFTALFQKALFVNSNVLKIRTFEHVMKTIKT